MKPNPAPPRLRRAYFECRYGQLHVHNAIPAGGGFDELTTLICLHASNATGRAFLEVSRLLGSSRSVYSPDTPGCGESDPPPKALSIAGYAEAIGDFLDAMRFRQVDLLGAHSGAAVAAELAIGRPKQVRRLVMVGAPALDADARRSYRDLSAPEGTPRGALWARAALIDWNADARLPLLKQPLLVLRPRDNFWEAGARIGRLVPGAKVVDLAEHDRNVLEKSPELVARQVSGFLG
ncbi:MAG TPA: alpha/beta fold hydrolase [Steroidobacteraceae bacterium]|nr:alpha/beta fold hydrolase [Steroidobacteraceae bacterium]